jgi:spore coat polysaccharide biosynthesis protein SpsF (cytidylyltransferase family)
MRSSRLPGKVMLKIEEKPMLYYVIKQVRSSKLIKDIIIATTTSREDDKIVNYCKKNKIKFFRGSKNDLLDRYYRCALKFGCNPIIRITSDCPLIDSSIIDKVIKKFLRGSYDYVANNLEKHGIKWNDSTCNFPQGMTVEISTFKALEKAWNQAKKPSEREHVFPYVQFNPSLFKVTNVKMKKDYSHIRCTVDRIEDLSFVREIYKKMPENKKSIRIRDIVSIIKSEPHLLKLNNTISFDEGYKKSLIEDKKHGY